MQIRNTLKDAIVTKYPEEVMGFVERNKVEGTLFELTIHDGEVANGAPEWMRRNGLRTRLVMERSYTVFRLIEDIVQQGRERARTRNLYRVRAWEVRIDMEGADTRCADLHDPNGHLSEARVVWVTASIRRPD